jgi:hypothetical protein
MPTGYIGMFVLAFFPKAFFWIMNPLLEAHRLEYQSDREPTEEELARVRELRLLARGRIWAWTLGCLGAATGIVAYSTKKESYKKVN